MTARETADEIEEAAVRWLWRLDREGRTPELAAELDAWLAGDTRRQGAFLQAEAAWAALDRGRQLAGVTPLRRRERPAVSRRALIAGGGTALAASLAGVAYLAFPRERYGTAQGEIRRVPLKDGSTAAINTASVVEVDLKPEIR
ncbi:MAG TPA: iron dicitrate transport regulator FecR, partial [Phenylobacterium sp.]|nr:iron dicitrate transport regulator FecR [Phenylobacterium sp.]